jgi:murein L,D-transpeptidase YafK
VFFAALIVNYDYKALTRKSSGGHKAKRRKEEKPKPEEQEGKPQHQHCPPARRHFLVKNMSHLQKPNMYIYGGSRNEAITNDKVKKKRIVINKKSFTLTIYCLTAGPVLD